MLHVARPLVLGRCDQERYLKYIELIVTSGSANAAAVSLSQIVELWRSDTLLMMDEVDLLLHPLKSELNFPIGKSVTLVSQALHPSYTWVVVVRMLGCAEALLVATE